MEKNILIVSASDGNNLKMANTLLEMSESLDANFEVIKLSDYKLPLYSSLEEKNGTPADAKVLAKKFMKANGFVFLAPEYNGSVPPALNNAIAWVSRSGDDWRDAFNSKPVALGTHSGGGGAHVLMAMQDQFSFIGCNIIGRKLHTHYSKELNPESANSVLSILVDLAK